LRSKEKRLVKPRLKAVHANLEDALRAGAVVIFAHCGLPYFASGPVGRLFEHSDFKRIKKYLEAFPSHHQEDGRCFADVSAFCTPFRKMHFEKLRRLDPRSLIYGSDFPTPIFELGGDLAEASRDFKAVLDGDLDRILVPQGNLLDVSHRELTRFFPDHPMFTNLGRLIRRHS
jgi:hypothetical protein